MLANLTGKGYDDWDLVATVEEEKTVPEVASYKTAALMVNTKEDKNNRILFAAIGVLGLVSLLRINLRKR
jgi:hypothetical protein